MSEITIEQAMQIARRHHDAGELADAEALYRLVLAAQADHGDALHRLGVVAVQTGRAELAVDLIRRAIAVNPSKADFHSHLGSALTQLGRYDAAIAAFRQAIALKPMDASFHFNLGTVLIESRQFDGAISALHRSLEIDQGSYVALNNLGNALVEKRDFDRAIDAYRRAISLKPDHAAAQVNLGRALAEIGRFDEAIACYQEALRIKPAYPEAFINLGNSLRQLKRFTDAIAAYRQVLVLLGDSATALNNIGVAHREAGQIDQAIAAHRKALQLEPHHVGAHYNLGNALAEKGLFDEAMAVYQQALRLNSDSAETHWAMGLLLLLQGQFEAGWREHEWRWHSKQFIAPRPNSSKPKWDGGDPRGRTILLYHEQGFGDTIQFVRYAGAIAEKGGRVIVHCPEPLARLLDGAAGVSAVAASERLPQFDFHCSMMSLPSVLGTRLETIPAEIPYLKVDATRVEAWGRKLEKSDGRLKVGLAWAGQPMHRDDYKRSIALAQLAPLAAIAGVTFFSLQKDTAAEQALGAHSGMELIDIAADLHDFADTAAVISHLDLVIAVDTAVVHLAGALGRPAWVLLPFKPDWRWMLGSEQSPWYPTLRLFRQRKPGDWAEVIDRVSRALLDLRG